MAKVKLLDPSDPRRKLDRYELIGEIATGGMATVFLARRGGVGGFQRFVAIKRLHPHLANEPEFVEMFLDEARLAALIHHPNVVPILEVGETEAGYYLVMEYVEGDTLSRIVARTMSLGQMPPRHVIVRMILDALAGLHAAHELRDDRGQLLGLVHRDCSPQNVLVGVDGTARITDFGVARASSRLTSTAHGKLKGKLAYMAPEQTRGDELDRRTDLFAMGIILWEVLCGKRLFKADSEAATLQRILVEPIRPPSEVNTSIPKCFDKVVLRALDRNQDKRFQTAADLIDGIEAAGREAAKQSVTDIGIASPREVASFVQTILGQEIGAQRESVRAWLAQSDSGQPLVIGGLGPSSPRHRRSPDPMAALPTTEIDPSMLAHRQKAAVTEDSGPQVVPHFEVAADVTMRFALEQPKAEPPPPVSPPRRPSEAPVEPPPPPAPPRAPPPAKQSQRTLIGQGPAALAKGAAAKNGVEGASTQQGLGAAVAQGLAAVSGSSPPHANGAANGALPKDAATVREGGVKYTPQMDDDLEDVVTIARPNTAPPPSAMQPAVKTARGLFAEPLLAEARARLEANGQVFETPPTNGQGSSPPAGPAKTPRMPMRADEVGISEPRLQMAQGLMKGRTEVMDGAAIVEAVAHTPRNPRTLVSNGEVSAGGFTPGSMTLSAESALRNHDALDPTVVHARPKRGYGKYIIVIAAFLLVFGTGLLLMRMNSGDSRTPEKAADKGKKSEPTGTAQPQNTSTAKAADPSVSNLPTADSTSPVVSSPVESASAGPRVDHPRPTPNTGRRPSKSDPTSTNAPPPPPPPASTGEDLTNPYR